MKMINCIVARFTDDSRFWNEYECIWYDSYFLSVIYMLLVPYFQSAG